MKLFVVILLLMTGGYAFAQSNKFTLIDKYVLSIKDTSPELLAKKLTGPYQAPKEKVRAIFKWVTENIAYDVDGYHATEHIYTSLQFKDTFQYRHESHREYNLQIVKKVIKEKKAICDGYSRLLKTLCDYANINCEIISGRGRHWDDEASQGSNHAWNAVMIGEQWYLLDATWGAGYTNDSVTKFTRSYDDFYFLTPPGAMINTHFPDDAKWMLLDEKPHLYQVYNTVYTYPNFYKANIRSIKPVQRMIEITPSNRKVVFELELPAGTVPKRLSFNEMPMMISGNAVTKVSGNKIVCEYEVISDDPKTLFVYYNSKPVLAYTIKMKK
jgi:hypothetical protein